MRRAADCRRPRPRVAGRSRPSPESRIPSPGLCYDAQLCSCPRGHFQRCDMRKLLVVGLLVLPLLVTGCSKGPAEAALKAADEAIAKVAPDAEKFVPDQFKTLTDAAADGEGQLRQGRLRGGAGRGEGPAGQGHGSGDGRHGQEGRADGRVERAVQGHADPARRLAEEDRRTRRVEEAAEGRHARAGRGDQGEVRRGEHHLGEGHRGLQRRRHQGRYRERRQREGQRRLDRRGLGGHRAGGKEVARDSGLGFDSDAQLRTEAWARAPRTPLRADRPARRLVTALLLVLIAVRPGGRSHVRASMSTRPRARQGRRWRAPDFVWRFGHSRRGAPSRSLLLPRALDRRGRVGADRASPQGRHADARDAARASPPRLASALYHPPQLTA
ncbi:MAG: hypothetical protein MZV63_23900 [Marinilabiliales bacterium]|nr:hypothetical protein [Marinilabiliales bacterium]